MRAIGKHETKGKERTLIAFEYLMKNRLRAVRPNKFTSQALVLGLCRKASDVKETLTVLRSFVERGGEVNSYQINAMLSACLRDVQQRRKENGGTTTIHKDIIDAAELVWEAGRGMHEVHTLLTYLKTLEYCGESAANILQIFEAMCFGLSPETEEGLGRTRHFRKNYLITPDDDILILAMQLKANDSDLTIGEKITYFERIAEKFTLNSTRAQNTLLLACARENDQENANLIIKKMSEERNRLYKPPDAFANLTLIQIYKKNGSSGDLSDNEGNNKSTMEAFMNYVMSTTTNNKNNKDSEKENIFEAMKLTLEVLRVLCVEVTDENLIKNKITSPLKVQETRAIALANARAIAEIATAFLGIPKYNAKVTSLLIEICATAKFPKEAKEMVDEYFAMRNDDETDLIGDARMLANVFASMRYNRFHISHSRNTNHKEHGIIAESEILDYFFETCVKTYHFVPMWSDIIENACRACRDNRTSPDALLKIYYAGRDKFELKLTTQSVGLALSALSPYGRWKEALRIVNEDVLEASMGSLLTTLDDESIDDNNNNKMMIPTDKIDEFGVKHLVLAFTNAGEIDQAFSVLRLCQFLTGKDCSKAFEIIESARLSSSA
jgi:hypothetical protein